MRLLASIVLAAAALVPVDSDACSCRGLPQYDAVFEGRVVESRIDPQSPTRYTEARFVITRHISGEPKDKVTVHSPLPVIMCGIALETGKDYVVHAVLVDGRYETKDCYGTRELPPRQFKGSAPASIHQARICRTAGGTPRG